MRLQTLGAPCLLGDDGEVLLGPGKPLLVLAYLEAHPEGVSREFLATLAWGDSGDRKARGSLRQTLLRLRKDLGATALSGEGQEVRLEAALDSDRAAFLQAVHDRNDARACALYTGPYLRGLEIESSALPGGWPLDERLRLARLVHGAMLREARGAMASQDDRRAASLAHRAIETDPSAIDGWLFLLEVLGATGRFGERDDVTVRLELAIQDGTIRPDGRAAALGAVADLRGRAVATPSVATRLHAGEGFPLVGRQALLARLLDRLAGREGSRVVVLEGSAGLGKSRLLREVARRLAPGGSTTVEVTAVGSEHATRWSLLTRLVRELTQRPGAAGMDAASLRSFVALDPTLAHRYPGIAVPSRDGHANEHLVAALVDLLASIAEQGPLAVLIDDLHHADGDSIAVLTAAFARREVACVSLLAATRPGHRQLPVEWPHWQVTPLDREAIEALLVEVVEGLGPEHRAEMAAALLLVSGGIPLYLRRATQLLSDDGHLGSTGDGRLRAVDAERLLAAVPNLSLHRDPSFPADPIERRLLGYLTVAEEDVQLEELAAGVGVAHRSALDGMLGRLAVAGWVHHAPDSDVARIAHAVLREQVIAVLGEPALRDLQERRGHWLAEHGTALVQIQAAVRLLHETGRDREALAAVRAWRQRPALRGRVGSAALAPTGSGALFRWRLALATRGAESVVTVMLMMLFMAPWIPAGLEWVDSTPTSLGLINVASVQPRAAGTSQTQETTTRDRPPVIEIRNRLGQPTPRLQGQPLRVILLHGADSLTMPTAPIVRSTSVRAKSLLAWSQAGETDSLLVLFKVGSLTSEPTVIWRGWGHGRLKVLGGDFVGQVIDSIRPTIWVRAGGRIKGSVHLSYNTPSPSAGYVLAEALQFGDSASPGVTVANLRAGATDTRLTINVDLVAPARAGVGWILLASGEDRSADYVFSRTDWRCGKPIWGDGNDLLNLPDSILMQAWGGGRIATDRRVCEPGQARWQSGLKGAPVAAIRVIVEG